MTRAGELWKKEMHTFVENGQSIAFDVVDWNVWLMNNVECDVLEEINGRTTKSAIVERLRERYPAGEVEAAIETWRARDVLADHELPPASIQENCPDVPTFMTLNVAQVCNLRCKYCFAYAGTYDQPAMMSREVARASVDMLMRLSGKEKHCSILFFGGEPMLNMDTISYTIEYAREQAKTRGKVMEFLMITNGTLLTPQNIDYLVRQRVRVEISIDGPAEFHDSYRVFADGHGSYAQVVAGARALCERSRWPVVANATLTSHHPPFKEIVTHFEALGFATSGVKMYMLSEKLQRALSNADLTIQGITSLQEECREYVYDLVAQNEFNPAFPNIFGFRTFVQSLADGRRRTCNCGVGRYLISISATGDVYPCYGLIGVKNGAYRMSNVLDNSLNFEWLENIRLTANGENRYDCRRCWGRYLCAGGANCFAYQQQGSVVTTESSWGGDCALTRRVMELAIYAVAVWRERDPQLFRTLRHYPVAFYLSKAAADSVSKDEVTLNG